jgi:2-dehydropantoate 2-reductase
MKICIYGAGAIGGFFGAKLALAGHEPSLIARGAHLAAMRDNGLKLITGGEEHVVRVPCSDDPVELGPHDVVILTCKAHAMADAAEAMAPLLHDDTTVVTTQNGLPWWYFDGISGPHEGHGLTSIDPGGRIRAAIETRRVIGGVVAAGCKIAEPGVIHHGAAGTIVMGELDGAETDRCRALAEILADSGVKASTTPEIRGEIWAKVWGNASFSSIAVLTGSTVGGLANDPALVPLAWAIMEEARAVGAAFGATFPVSIAQRVEHSRGMGGHKTSILQDLEAGRPMEVDAVVGSVLEAARIAGVAIPRTDEIYALVRRRAIEAGCYPENPEFADFLTEHGAAPQ